MSLLRQLPHIGLKSVEKKRDLPQESCFIYRTMGAGRRVGDTMNPVGRADSFIYGLHCCLGIGCAYHHPEATLTRAEAKPRFPLVRYIRAITGLGTGRLRKR